MYALLGAESERARVQAEWLRGWNDSVSSLWAQIPRNAALQQDPLAPLLEQLQHEENALRAMMS